MGSVSSSQTQFILYCCPNRITSCWHVSPQTWNWYNTVVLHNAFPYLLHNRFSEPALSNQNPLLVSVHLSDLQGSRLWINSCWLDHRSPHHQEENISDLLINSSFNNGIIDWRKSFRIYKLPWETRQKEEKKEKRVCWSSSNTIPTCRTAPESDKERQKAVTDVFRPPRSLLHPVRRADRRMGCRGFRPGRK